VGEGLLGESHVGDGLIPVALGDLLASGGYGGPCAVRERRDLLGVGPQRGDRGLSVLKGELVDLGDEDGALRVDLGRPGLQIVELGVDPRGEVAEFAATLGLSMQAVVASPLPGPSGNVEYFLWLKKDGGASAASAEDMRHMIHRAVEEGPQ